MGHRAHRLTLELTGDELELIEVAARDTHLTPEEYGRIMLLVAAGYGGLIEHVERAADASALMPEYPRPSAEIAAERMRAVGKRVRIAKGEGHGE